MVLMSTETVRLIRDGEKVGEGGVEGGGRGRLHTYRYTVTTRMTPALRWAVMRAILTFHNCEGQSHKTVSTDHNFWRERRAEADSNQSPSAYQPNALLLGQTGSLACPKLSSKWHQIYIALTGPSRRTLASKVSRSHTKLWSTTEDTEDKFT